MVWPFTTQKAAPERTPAEAPAQPDVLYLSNGMGVGIIKWNEYIAMESAMRHPIVYRALDKLATSVQQVKWFAEIDPEATAVEQRGKERTIQDLNALLASPNGEMTGAQLRYWLTLNYAGYGRVPFKVGFSTVTKTKPNGIYPLEARLVSARFNDRGAVIGYKYGHGENEQSWPSRAFWNEGNARGFVSQVWRPGLKGYQHHQDINSPLEAIGLPAQVIKSLLLRAIATAEGHPNVRYLVTCSKTLTDPQKKALKRYLNEDHGPDGPNEGKVPILQNAADVEIHKLDNDLSDIHSKMPSDDMARLIFGAFGIPIALAGMGAADGAKFAGNYIESRAAFWQDTIIPGYIEPLTQGMSVALCPPGVRISADLDSVPALMQGRIMSMKEVETVTFLTTNEKRELFGWGPTNAIPASAQPTAAPGGQQDEENNDGA